jgi:kynurenine formamidase
MAGFACCCWITAMPAAGEDWFPSRFGAEDTLGAVNFLTPTQVVEAAKLVTQGKTYALGVPTGPDTPAYPGRGYRIITMASGDGSGQHAGENQLSGTDDVVISHMGIGSQLDGLGHVGIAATYYNGTPAADFVRPDGLAKFSTHLVPPIVARGVMLDIASLKGVSRLPAGTAINSAEIQAAAQKQGLTIQKGNVVLLHTGWGSLADSDPVGFMKGEPGLGVDGAKYLVSQSVVAIGADTWGVEVIPFENPKRVFEVHQTLLTKSGTYILENMNTAELAKDGVSEFLFVLGQPRFVGTVQVVINPIAIR